LGAEVYFENISVVLVETLSGGNIGSVARAMKNMGLRRLKLVSPQEYMSEECRMMAGKAIHLVEEAQLCSSLNEAVSEQNLIIGTTSSRSRRKRQSVYTPREIGKIVRRHARSQRVALLFGPERRGLSDTQLAKCHYVLSVSADPEYPVLNLSHAVMILAYEIYGAVHPKGSQSRELASDQTREQMFRHVERVLINIGFLSSHHPQHIMGSIRRLLGRAELSSRDIKIIRGVMAQMEWYTEEGRKLPAEKLRKP